MACESKADIIGYGGQAGGGKTDLAVGLAVMEHYRTRIFRRYYTDLKDIVDRAKQITDGHRTALNMSDFTLSLPGGAKILFAAMAMPSDWERFKGRPVDAMIFDEVTEFIESQVRSIIAWVRSTRPNQRRRIVFTFNPPTSVSGEWVIRFFAPWLDKSHPNPALPGDLRWYVMLDGIETEVPTGDPIEHGAKGGETETLYPMSRTFIPAKLADNQFLAADGEYRRMLQATPEPLRSQLLYGKFDTEQDVDKWQVIPTAWVEAAILRGKARARPTHLMTAMGVDVAHGGRDRTVIARRYDDWIAPLLIYEGKETPDGKSAAKLVMDAYEGSGYINVDAIGYGASCAEKLLDAEDEGGWAMDCVTAMNVGTKSTYRDKSRKYKMYNKRAEMHWRLRDALDPDNDSQFALPDDRGLVMELCSATWCPKPSGIHVESKDEIKKRTTVSPDLAEAVMLSMLEGGSGWAAVEAAQAGSGDEKDTLHGYDDDDTSAFGDAGLW